MRTFLCGLTWLQPPTSVARGSRRAPGPWTRAPQPPHPTPNVIFGGEHAPNLTVWICLQVKPVGAGTGSGRHGQKAAIVTRWADISNLTHTTAPDPRDSANVDYANSVEVGTTQLQLPAALPHVGVLLLFPPPCPIVI
mmetsp:Transcript_37956/g.63000  ORF Transcript_37956/g.63000 Transcript_37956/m.63000 type:complete len:138 (-) Transcript_37956:14-427(-)